MSFPPDLAARRVMAEEILKGFIPSSQWKGTEETVRDLTVLLGKWQLGVIHGQPPVLPHLETQRPTDQSHG